MVRFFIGPAYECMFEKNLGKIPKRSYHNTIIIKREVSLLADRRAALEMALRNIEKQFGKGSIMKLGESTHMQIETIPSG